MKNPKHSTESPATPESSGRYSATDQQEVPEYAHGDHKQGTAAPEAPGKAGKPWHGQTDQREGREGQYGFRRDEGAQGAKVDGDTAPPPPVGKKDRPTGG